MLCAKMIFVEYQHLVKKLKVFNDIKQYAQNNQLASAYLFLSPDRLTNKELLFALAKLLLCKNTDACGTCEHCVKMNVGTHPDVLIYPKEKNFVVEDANGIYETVQVKPMLADKKIYIINDIDLATEQAENKLLKIIEEPPQNVIFLFSAVTREKVLATILSRVYKHTVDKFASYDLQDLLKNIDEQTKNITLAFGDGYLGKTLDIFKNAQFLDCYNNMKSLLFNLKKSDQIPFFAGSFNKDKQIFEINLTILNDFYRDLLMLKLNQEQMIKNKNIRNDLTMQVNEYSVKALYEIIKKLSKAKQMLDRNVNITVLADNLLFEILEVKYLWK